MPEYNLNATLCQDIGTQNGRPIKTGGIKNDSTEEVRHDKGKN